MRAAKEDRSSRFASGIAETRKPTDFFGLTEHVCFVCEQLYSWSTYKVKVSKSLSQSHNSEGDLTNKQTNNKIHFFTQFTCNPMWCGHGKSVILTKCKIASH